MMDAVCSKHMKTSLTLPSLMLTPRSGCLALVVGFCGLELELEWTFRCVHGILPSNLPNDELLSLDQHMLDDTGKKHSPLLLCSIQK